MLVRKGAFLVAIAMILLPVTASAQSVELFYKGKQITMNINSKPGGAHDAYGRLVARHLGQFLPGKPGFVTKNMPGGGGLVAVNYLFRVAPQDGTEIGVFDPDGIIEPFLGNNNARFDPTKFNWIGSVNNEVPVTVLWHTAPVKTMDEVFKKETIVGGTGASFKNETLPRFYNKYLGTKFKVISGYEGSTGEVLLAMQRGEVYGNAAWSYASVLLQADQYLKSGELRIIMQAGPKRVSQLKDIPWLYDYVKDEHTRQILDLMLAGGGFSRPFGAPPGVLNDRVKALRIGFAEMINDSSFIEDAKKIKLPVEYTAGEEIENILVKLSRTPQDVIEAAKEAMEPPKK